VRDDSIAFSATHRSWSRRSARRVSSDPRNVATSTVAELTHPMRVRSWCSARVPARRR